MPPRSGDVRPPAPRATLVHLVALAATLGIFLLDLLLPPGSAVTALYFGVILLGFWSPWPSFPWVAALGAAALVAIDASLGWRGPPAPVVLVNGAVLGVGFGLAAALVSRAAHLHRATLAHVDVLDDVKRALDAAAIVAITDVRGRITYVNDTFCDISGYSRDELLGEDHRLVNSGYHPPAFIRDLWQTIAQGNVWHGEIRNRAKDGHVYWVDTTIVPLLDMRAHPYEYIAIRSDITARKRAEETLTRQAALAQVGQMAAVLAHEIRNPLAGIKAAAEILLSRRAPDDAERAVLRDIVDRIEALTVLLNDLMVFARPRPPTFSDVRLLPLVQDAIALVRRDPLAADVAFDVEGEDAVASVDRELVRATLLNLLINAAQAMQGQGAIHLTLGRDGATASIAVCDTGPGIAPEIRGQVFEPFFTTKTHGGGLGLAIARRTAELHGGSLEFSCPADGGTVMTLVLPLRRTGDAPAG